MDENSSKLHPILYNDTTILVILLLLVIFAITIGISLYKTRKHKLDFWTTLKSEITPGFISWGIGSGITTIVLLFIPEQKDHTILLYTIGTLIFYILYVSFYKDHLSKLNSDIIQKIRKESSKSIVYKEHYDIFFNIDRERYSSFIIDSIVKDHHTLTIKNQFLISDEGYISLLEKLIEMELNLFGVNYVLPPYWFSPKYIDSSLKSFYDKAKQHKNKTKRINVYADKKWEENATKEIIEYLLEDPKFQVAKTYCWILNLFSSIIARGKLVNGQISDYLLNDIELSENFNFLDESSDAFLNIKKEIKLAEKYIRTLLEDTELLKTINTSIDTLFYDDFGDNTIKISRDKFQSNFDPQIVELMLAQNHKIKIGLAVRYKMGKNLRIQLIRDNEYRTYKQRFDALFNEMRNK